MKILITGAGGQLGRDTAEALRDRGHDVIAADRAALDVSDGAEVERFFALHRPEQVIHCAAYTAVDRAEEDKERCFAVNAGGSAHVAACCKARGAGLIYISTDYVFDGIGDAPRKADDPCAPLSVYGESKLRGEEAVRAALEDACIVRTSWVFGASGQNFVKTVLRLARSGTALRVVDDQIGSPTYTRDLAALLCRMAERGAKGTFHAANRGFCSRYELARETLRLAALSVPLSPIPSDDYPQKARRPKNSRLDCSALTQQGFSLLPPWQDALERFLKEL